MIATPTCEAISLAEAAIPCRPRTGCGRPAPGCAPARSRMASRDGTTEITHSRGYPRHGKDIRILFIVSLLLRVSVGYPLGDSEAGGSISMPCAGWMVGGDGGRGNGEIVADALHAVGVPRYVVRHGALLHVRHAAFQPDRAGAAVGLHLDAMRVEPP